MNYHAFHFRNDQRTIFGIREQSGKGSRLDPAVCEKWAFKVVTDARFRRGLISDDPELPLLWKGR